MNHDIISRIATVLDLLADAARLSAQELAAIAPDGHDLRRIAKIQRQVEDAQGMIDTLEDFL